MHKYLKAIGFSKLETKKQINLLLNDIIDNPDRIEENDNQFMEYIKKFSEDAGIAVRGEKNEKGKFEIEYYYPFCIGSGITTEESITIERHSDKEAYSGICDDLKVGVMLIFYLQNIHEYMKGIKNNSIQIASLTLVGLSLSGKILFPIVKDEMQRQKGLKESSNRNTLMAAARQGDEEAMENLTLEDIDTYTMISRRVLNEDIFSMVDSFFMPSGIESDHYSILGEIVQYKTITNSVTKEVLYKMQLNCNDLIFDICINKEDLLGEPKEGRRFKGVIWLQGNLNMKKDLT